MCCRRIIFCHAQHRPLVLLLNTKKESYAGRETVWSEGANESLVWMEGRRGVWWDWRGMGKQCNAAKRLSTVQDAQLGGYTRPQLGRCRKGRIFLSTDLWACHVRNNGRAKAAALQEIMQKTASRTGLSRAKPRLDLHGSTSQSRAYQLDQPTNSRSQLFRPRRSDHELRVRDGLFGRRMKGASRLRQASAQSARGSSLEREDGRSQHRTR